jgi:hypothetical protein
MLEACGNRRSINRKGKVRVLNFRYPAHPEHGEVKNMIVSSIMLDRNIVNRLHS